MKVEDCQAARVRQKSNDMGVLKGDARLACVDLSNYAERKDEITKQLMEAATTVGCDTRHVLCLVPGLP